MKRPGPAALAVLLFVVCDSSVAAEADAQPACTTPAHGEFDFWVGDWDVYRPDGTPAGSSHVERILEGCVIFENWRSASGSFAGKSFNTYDPNSGRWNQVWVDTGGNTIQFSGRRRDNVMSMAGTHSTGRGTLHYRMTYTIDADGSIRQLWRQSVDRRKWEVLFDGIYRRRTDVAGQ